MPYKLFLVVFFMGCSVVLFQPTSQSFAASALEQPSQFPHSQGAHDIVELRSSEDGVELVKVETIGRCAVENFTPRQAQRLALRQARALAVEKAAGINVTSSSLVTNGTLAGDFIKSFSSGYIIEETVRWLPITQYQQDTLRPPIIEYSVQLSAVVNVPAKKTRFSGLRAHLNQNTFRAYKEEMKISVSTHMDSRIAIFNIMADDTVTMLYPHNVQTECILRAHEKRVFPSKDKGALLVAPIQGNKRDTEAILVAALPENSSIHWMNMFFPDEQLTLTEFFTRYSTAMKSGDDIVLPYEVFE